MINLEVATEIWWVASRGVMKWNEVQGSHEVQREDGFLSMFRLFSPGPPETGRMHDPFCTRMTRFFHMCTGIFRSLFAVLMDP